MTHGQVMCMQGNNIPVTDLAALQAAQQALNAITGGFGRRRHMLQYNKAQGLTARTPFHNVLLPWGDVRHPTQYQKSHCTARERRRKGGNKIANCLPDELLDAYLKGGKAEEGLPPQPEYLKLECVTQRSRV